MIIFDRIYTNYKKIFQNPPPLTSYIESVKKDLHAIRTVLSKFNNNEKDITIRNFVSRRSTLLNKKCGGVRMHCLPLRTIIEPTATVLESMNIINKEQQEMFLHADYSTMKFYYEQRLAYNTEPGA